jgi:hypothetical protein
LHGGVGASPERIRRMCVPGARTRRPRASHRVAPARRSVLPAPASDTAGSRPAMHGTGRGCDGRGPTAARSGTFAPASRRCRASRSDRGPGLRTAADRVGSHRVRLRPSDPASCGRPVPVASPACGLLPGRERMMPGSGGAIRKDLPQRARIRRERMATPPILRARGRTPLLLEPGRNEAACPSKALLNSHSKWGRLRRLGQNATCFCMLDSQRLCDVREYLRPAMIHRIIRCSNPACSREDTRNHLLIQECYISAEDLNYAKIIEVKHSTQSYLSLPHRSSHQLYLYRSLRCVCSPHRQWGHSPRPQPPSP